MEKRKIIVIVSMLLGAGILHLAPLATAANTVVFYPNDDTMINQGDSPNTVFGDWSQMVVRNAYGSSGTSVSEIDSLIKFDVFSIPSSVTIVSASLHLYYYNWSGSNATGRSLTLYRITSGWNEESIRWNTKPSCAATLSSSSTVPESKGQWMTWDVKNDVQYLANERINFGWKITDENNWGQANIPSVSFRTKEYGNYIPFLEVTYTAPETTTTLISGFSILPLTPSTEETVQFTDTSYNPDAAITAWLWNFGDGNSSTSRNPTHTYTQSGQYTVTLKVTDATGTTDVMTTSLSISDKNSTPGFEILIVACAIAIVLFLKQKGKKRN